MPSGGQRRVELVLGALVMVCVPCVLGAQAPARDSLETRAGVTRVSAEIGVALPSVWAEGAEAPSVRTLAVPLFALRAVRDVTPAVRAGIIARTTTSTVRLRESNASWNGGTLTLSDVLATVAWRSTDAKWNRASLELAAGASFIIGADDVAPFHDAPPCLPTLDGAIAIDLPWRFGRNQLAVVAHGSWLRIGGGTTDDPVREPGVVTRATIGIRFGR